MKTSSLQITPVINTTTEILRILMIVVTVLAILGGIIMLVATIAETNQIAANITGVIALVMTAVTAAHLDEKYISVAAEQFKSKA